MRPPRASRAIEDILLLAIVGALLFLLLTGLSAFTHLAEWLHARALIDDLVSLVLIVILSFAVFAWRRWREAEAARRELRILSGVIPICAWCRKVREDGGYWRQIEAYISERSQAQFSHGICPDCMAKFHPGAAATGTDDKTPL